MTLQTEIEDALVDRLGTFTVRGVDWTTANTREPRDRDQVLLSLDLTQAERTTLETMAYAGELVFEAYGEHSGEALDHIRSTLLVDTIFLTKDGQALPAINWDLWKVDRGTPDDEGLTLDVGTLRVSYIAEPGA